MTYQDTRAALHAYLTVDAHDTIQEFADVHGVSVTGLMQSLAEELQEEIEVHGLDVRPEWVLQARKVDALRRRRRTRNVG